VFRTGAKVPVALDTAIRFNNCTCTTLLPPLYLYLILPYEPIFEHLLVLAARKTAINPVQFTCPVFVIFRSNSRWCQLTVRCQDSEFSIATRYGFERRWGPRGFLLSILAQTGPGLHLVSCTVGTGFFFPRG
jgi:hypothetical protein